MFERALAGVHHVDRVAFGLEVEAKPGRDVRFVFDKKKGAIFDQARDGERGRQLETERRARARALR